MHLTPVLCSVTILVGLAQSSAGEDLKDYPIRPVAAHHVEFGDSFWRPRIEVNRTTTIPYSFQTCEETGRIENFKVAGGLSDKAWTGKFGFNDSDVSKIVEGAAYSLMTHPDPKLAAYVGELIGYMAAAQEDDGYLYTAWTARDRIDNPKNILCCFPKQDKWLGLQESHELYNLGHVYEAAAAHYEATGKKDFLDVAVKSADLLVETFGPGKIEIPPGHPEIELGLVRLYRATHDRRYLGLARYFVDLRGTPTTTRPKLWGETFQDHRPLREQSEAVGHSVRAMYLYAGAADVAALTGDRSLSDAVNRLWDNVVSKKTYVTGGIGATGEGEGFGKNYELPNRTAYCETCANLATCYWNHRMFLLDGDAKYIDVLERAVYNSVVSGVSLDGKQFFYPNPLASRGDTARSKWFDCCCCPTNLCRFIPSVPGYAYAVGDDGVYVNLFVAGTAKLTMGENENVMLAQRTDYPWDGGVTIKVTPSAAGDNFKLFVRIPGWSQNQAWPTDLYTYLGDDSATAALKVNGEAIAVEPVKGYAVIDRAWQPGDTVSLKLPMPVRRVIAHDEVLADRGRVAVMRGPIVYCVEGTDVAGGKVGDLVLGDDSALETEFRPDLLGGVQVVTGDARHGDDNTDVPFIAVPYCVWANREPAEMTVWLARTSAAAEPEE